MLRMYIAQQGFGLFDEATEDAIYELVRGKLRPSGRGRIERLISLPLIIRRPDPGSMAQGGTRPARR